MRRRDPPNIKCWTWLYPWNRRKRWLIMRFMGNWVKGLMELSGWGLTKGLIKRLLSRYIRRRRLTSPIRSRIWKGRSIFWLNFPIVLLPSWLTLLKPRLNFILYFNMEVPTLFTTTCYRSHSIDCRNMKPNSFYLSYQKPSCIFTRGILSIGILKLRTFSSTDIGNSSWLILVSVLDARN